MSAECNHLISIGADGQPPNTVQLYNDDDSFYVQTFRSRAELDVFINALTEARDRVWPNSVADRAFKRSLP